MLTRGKVQPVERPKRFYATADPGEVDGAFGVLLDGKAMRTPAGARLKLPTPALAQLVAAEWASQGEHIVIEDMPATRLAYTALDRAPDARAEVAEEIAGRAGADVLCYFAEAPDSLVERQIAHWGPVLGWAAEALAVKLVRVAGLIHQPQPEPALDRVRALALELDDFALTGLVNAAGLYGSAVLAFALQRGELTGEEAFDLSRLDEAFQEERWGVDEEAAERTTRLRHEAQVLDLWFQALRAA
jgi:chaperone required for assembly of F1-ATPase